MSGGKSYALLLEPLRHMRNPHFGGTIFRRTREQIRVEGGLWDTASLIYPLAHARGYKQSLDWRFPSGASVNFAGIEHEKDLFNYQGAQMPYIAFDELTHFDKKMFWYMFSRNRSPSGVSGYIRAACNPDPDSWVKEFIQWWLDPLTGYAIPARSGKIRYFWRHRDVLHWAFNPETLKKQFGAECMPKSVTFIKSTVHDNKILLEKDPAYIANLHALPEVEREQLLNGNWNVRPSSGTYFRASTFGVVDFAPVEVIMRVRYWDRAATPKQGNNDPDATCGLLLSKTADGMYFIEDVQHFFEGPFEVEKAIKETAAIDGKDVIVAYNQDPGSAGVYEAQSMSKKLDGYSVIYWPKTGSKANMAKPVATQARAGNFKLVRGLWNGSFARELENFTGEDNDYHDDQVDALSGAYEVIQKGRLIFVA